MVVSVLYPALGAITLAVTVVDLVWTTLSSRGAGPLSRGFGRVLWLATGRAAVAGPVILIGTAALWVGLLWLGWTLVFMGAPEAVVTASGGAPAGFWERVYFGGYTVATLGLGDYVPDGPLWRVLTVTAAASGLVLITLAVTYYTAVLGAVVHKQQLAAMACALGPSPAAMVARAWDGERFDGLDTILPSLAEHLTLHARRHYAYPVIHYFRSREADEAIAVQLARLNDAIVLLDRVVAEDHRPPPAALHLVRGSLSVVLRTLDDGFVERDADAPPVPDLARLRAAAVPLLDAEAAFADDGVGADRRLLHGFIRQDGFSWRDVDPDPRP